MKYSYKNFDIQIKNEGYASIKFVTNKSKDFAKDKSLKNTSIIPEKNYKTCIDRYFLKKFLEEAKKNNLMIDQRSDFSEIWRDL